MHIQWSDEDQIFMVILPEFGNALTDGKTYAEAVRQGKSLIESFFMWYAQDGKPLPKPVLFNYDEVAGARFESELVAAS